MPNIKLQSSDGAIFNTDDQIVKCSRTIKIMLEDGDDGVVPLLNVNSAILSKILQWVNNHKDDAQSPEDNPNKPKRSDDISSWDAEFLNVDQDTLLALISAAHFLGIKGLVEVTSKTVANMMKGKAPAEIREIFNIKNDFTQRE